MAEGHVKQVLEKEVTCPLCLDILQEPKKLPCDHVYCKSCLERLAINRRVDLDAPFLCPECRTQTQIPNGDVNNFPTAFRLNRLIEAFQRVEVREVAAEPVDEAKCKLHPAQPIAIYCEECNELFCRDCVLAKREHADHNYGFISDMKEKLRLKLARAVSAVDSREQSLSKVVEEIDHVQCEIAVYKSQCQQEIEEAFGALYRKLQESEQKMIQQAAQHYKSVNFPFLQTKTALLSVKNEVTMEVEKIRQSLHENDTECLIHQSSMQQRLEMLLQKLSKTSLSVPNKPPLLMPKVMTDDELEQHLEKRNGLYAIDPTKWQVSGSLFDHPQADQQHVITVESIRSGSKLWKSLSSRKDIFRCKSELVCTRSHSIIKGEVQQHSQDRFSVTIKSPTGGQHKLSIKINGVHIAGSPFTVFIQFRQPIADIGVYNPVSLCYSGGKILATEGKRRIIEVSLRRAVQNQTVLELDGVEEITADPHSNVIYATTPRTHLIYKFTKNGDLIQMRGGYGVCSGKFNYPSGLRLSKRGELYVCDSHNHRVQVLDLDLNFKRLLGGTRDESAIQFRAPSDVDFDQSGKIYITNNEGYHLHVFTSEELFLFVIGNTSIANSLLHNPVSLVVHDELLYITEYSKHRVSIMTTKGKLIARLGAGLLQNPEGIAVDEDGFIYVTSHHSKILVF